MTDDPDWQPLVEELGRWSEAGATALFWLRDDDAVEPTPALDRLLELAGAFAVPVTLAVIPAFADERLSRRLQDAKDVEVAVHGWSHANHAPAGVKKRELGPDRPQDMALRELADGLGRLDRLFGKDLVPVLVPPWNRIDAELLAHLPGLGYKAVSVFGMERPSPALQVNTHVDVMDWHGTRGGRETDVLVGEIAARLAVMRASGGSMGLLTHHLVHDDAVWTFLERLFALTSRHLACQWARLSTIVAAQMA
ncbi:putative glycosyl transferase [Hartmannibacter diazotrophicus]|uniref:Putative glycosyl transferase n=1 Tax=Hartmannibacter diazotrophicus TaxID=1482074 RepID=A0A2C9DCE1_9HYPH|nr:polysaccharide deacetylase family protein [Hartmannibacter diazotrophicus]SON57391.1 putative glycosyl transferase [Hartmannibacter diazotrophicus]